MQKSNKNVIGNPGHRIKACLLNHWLLFINFYNFYILLYILNHQYYVQCIIVMIITSVACNTNKE